VPSTDRVLFAGLGAALLLAAAAGWVLFAGVPAAADPSPSPIAAALGADRPSPAPSASGGVELLVDVEGGVAEPGIQHLPAGARVADALVAAGGYGPKVDLAAAARQLNLAAPLTDGQQIYVPQLGDANGAAGSGAGGSGAAGGGSGLVNLNQATPEALDALPGIGPVTVQKIVAARQEQAFSSLEELVSRKVLTASQLDKIRDQVTV
jgi:competence protein ComEA